MSKVFINSMPYSRGHTERINCGYVTVKVKENINGTIYVKDKQIPLSEHLKQSVPARNFKLNCLLSAGVPLEDVNTTSFLDTRCTEHKVLDKDLDLQLQAKELAEHLDSLTPYYDTGSENVENNDNN